MKCGRSTAWTVGISNELQSDCQRDGRVVSTEWCIIDQPGSNTVFSMKGDSGAAVLDFTGRVAGILHGGGHTKSSGAELTYATPIEWIFEDIKEHLGVKSVELA